MNVDLPPRGPQCPPALALERMLAGEPSSAAPHVDQCRHCQSYLEALHSQQVAFLAARPTERFVHQLERRATTRLRWPRWQWWCPTLGLAAVALIALQLPKPDGGGDATLKGSPFRAMLKATGAAEPSVLSADALLQAGDVLRFAYDAPRPGYLMVLDLDGTEEATSVYPLGAERSAPIAPGGPQPLPGAIKLDDRPGPEWLIAVFSETPIELEALSSQLRGQSRRAKLAVRCQACQVETLRFQKRVTGKP